MLVHLHNHSDFSFLDGLQSPTELVKRAVELGCPAVALTDHGGVAGHVELMDAAKEHGIKPIYGYEGYHYDLDFHTDKRKPFHLTLWAMNEEGLHNLWALSSQTYLDAIEHERPLMGWRHLVKHSDGLIASSACLAGALSRAAMDKNEEMAKRYLDLYQMAFDGRFFIELHTNSIDIQRDVNVWLASFAERHNVPVIHAGDAHYSRAEDSTYQNVLLGISTRKKFNEDHMRMGPDYYLMTEEEIRNRLRYLPPAVVDKAFAGTEQVFSMVDDDITIDTSTKIPQINIPEEFKGTHEDYLRELATRGFCEKVGGYERQGINQDGRAVYFLSQPPSFDTGVPKDQLQTYLDQTLFELDFIIKHGLTDYFLTVADYTMYAKTKMLVGPGRGSAAGSIVSWLIGITEVDPIKGGLMFECFLNEGRVDSLPDVDLDFPDLTRYLVEEYLRERYGQEHVAPIGTIGRFAMKSALKDAAFYYNVDYQTSQSMADIVESIPDLASKNSLRKMWPWDAMVESMPDDYRLEFLRYESEYPQVFAAARKLYNVARQSSQHAAGIIISPISLLSSLPLRRKKGTVTTQFDMKAVERLGFLKVDVLGLRTLSTLTEAIQMVEARTGEKVDLYRLKDEDYALEAVWDMLGKGRTLGVFQAETDGITGLLKKMKPKSLDDLSVAVALYRPGVIRSRLSNGRSMLEEYLARRCGETPVTYAHPDLEAILADTFGIMVYQEQILQICKKFAGYSPVEADNMRSIVGKKKADKMVAEEEKFVSRCVANGYDRHMVTELFANIKEFASYGFNKAHSYSYGMISFWCAYMKVKHPVEFMAALLNTDPDKTDQYLRECKRMGIVVTPPHVNHSKNSFTIVDVDPEEQETGIPSGYVEPRIVFGLLGISQVGEVAANSIMEEAPYISFEDFMTRVPKKVNKTVITNLIKAGAFQGLASDHRAELLHYFEDCCVPASKNKKVRLCPEKPEGWVEVEPYGDAAIAELELSLLGNVISVDFFKKAKMQLGTLVDGLPTMDAIEEGLFGRGYSLLVTFTSVRLHRTRNKSTMAFVGFETHRSETGEFTVTPDKWGGVSSLIRVGKVAGVELVKEDYKGKAAYKLNNIMLVN